MEKITIEDAINMIRRCYEDAIKNPYVRKPVAYALYMAWKYYDKVEKAERK